MELEIAKYFCSLKGTLVFSAFQIITGKIYILLTGVAFIVFALLKLRQKAVIFILAVFIALAVSDMICYRVLKPLIRRPRPSVMLNKDCTQKSEHIKETYIMDRLNTKDYSMPSNHASNIFAFFTVYFIYVRRFWGLFLFNSVLISVSRIVLVKHYTSDVLAGMLIGIAIGLCIVSVFSLFGYKPDKLKRWRNPI